MFSNEKCLMIYFELLESTYTYIKMLSGVSQNVGNEKYTILNKQLKKKKDHSD